ncbi:phage terminase large subunit [Moraxella sp. ZJ142]|uniref:phage terminase large subunit n=1 Tax=Moraxella marmotae TaxID=3344520 RepID=UPI0035D48C64
MDEKMPSLNIPQAKFLNMPHKFRAYVAGFGSGKTWAGCAGLCKHFWEFPNVNAGYFAPTYPQIRDIFYPTMEECAKDWGLTVQIKHANKEVEIYSGNQYRGMIICRSMDNPNSIVGFKIGHALVDELDTLNTDKARDAWRKIIARMRYNVQGLKNGIDVTTTPEGFKFTYEQFVKEASRDEIAKLYGIIQASTYDNEQNLPDGYIESLRQSYPSQLIEAYLNGQFVNLTSGAVYPDFDRRLNATDATIQPHETLHIGMDFNVLNMSAVVHVVRDNVAYAVDEIAGARDTPAMCQIIKQRYANHHIVIYPDASGHNTSSKSSSVSDHSILRQAGFAIKVASVNPSIKDRINAMNALICNAKGHRQYFVNPKMCPEYIDCLEKQVYDKAGMPDKSAGHDHMNDAGGYFVAYQYPISKPVLTSFIEIPY